MAESPINMSMGTFICESLLWRRMAVGYAITILRGGLMNLTSASLVAWLQARVDGERGQSFPIPDVEFFPLVRGEQSSA